MSKYEKGGTQPFKIREENTFGTGIISYNPAYGHLSVRR